MEWVARLISRSALRSVYTSRRDGQHRGSWPSWGRARLAAAGAAIQLREDVRDGAETRLSGLILPVERQV